MKTGDSLFALFYPIANTQEDNHLLREGKIISLKGPGGDNRFFEIDFSIKSGEGGAAIFNNNREIIGITLSQQDIRKILGHDLKISKSKWYGLKISSLKGLSEVISKITKSHSSLSKKRPDLSKRLPDFIKEIQKNILLIEVGT